MKISVKQMKGEHLLVIISFALILISIQAVQPAKASAQASILPNHSGYLDTTSIPITYHVVGEIENTGTTNLQWLKVTANFYDENNSLIGSSSSYALLDVLLPGRKTPFEVVLKDSNVNRIKNYTLTLQFNEYIYEKPLGLEILKSTTYIDEAGFQKVNGTVKNITAKNATAVKVAATFYDEEGKVRGVAYSYTTPSTIGPNQTALFELELKRKGLFFPNYILTAESLEYAMVPEFPSLNFCCILIFLSLTMLFFQLKVHNHNRAGAKIKNKIKGCFHLSLEG